MYKLEPELLRSTKCEGEVRRVSRERSIPDYSIRGCDANGRGSHLFLFYSISWIIRRAVPKVGRRRRSSILFRAILFGGLFGGRRLGRASPPLYYSIPHYSILSGGLFGKRRASLPLFYSIPHYLMVYSAGGVYGTGRRRRSSILFYSILFYSILFGGAFGACATLICGRGSST